MRLNLLRTSIAFATFVMCSSPARDAFAQRRRHRGSGASTQTGTTSTPSPATNENTPTSASGTTSTPSTTTPVATNANPTAEPARTAVPSDADHASGAESHARHAARAEATEPEVLVSNVIDRPGYHRTRVEGELFGSVGPGAWAWPWGGFVVSAGIRAAFPLTQNGPIARMNNDFRLVIGAQGYLTVTPTLYAWVSAPVTLQWNFYISEQWSVVLEAGLGVDVFVYDYLNCYDHPQLYCDRIFFHPVGAFGLRRHLGSSGAPGAPSVSFRFQYPGGVQLALGF